MGRTGQSRLIHLDTHVLIWLYEGKLEELSGKVRTLIESDQCWVSPMAILELQYLFECGRNALDAATVMTTLRRTMGIEVSNALFSDVIEHSLDISWTRDAFDRLIVANAICEDAWLLTRDHRIREHFPEAIW